MSNGSESTPERCVHAVDGPDWAGLRELYPAEVDYKTLVEVARARYKLASDEMDRLTAGNPGTNWRWSIPANPDRDSDLILSASAEDVPRLADAVEALLRRARGDAGELVKAARALKALQARLDAMTVEWGVALPGEDGFGTPDRVTAESFVRDYPEEEYSLVQRLVGPWTVVPEGEQQ